MIRPNLLDRLALQLAPGWGLSRLRSRAAAQLLRDYDAAAGGRRTSSWRAKNTSANAEIAVGLPKVRDRHRELIRNNPWAVKAMTAIVGNTVSYGITGAVVHPDAKRQERLNGYWKRWAETTAIDADGLHDVYGLQALAMGGTAESGEVLLRRRWRRAGDLEVPLQIQVLEGDYLDHSRTVLTNSGRIVQGVEFDRIGRRTAYYLFRDHPGDSLTRATESVPIPARDVAHVFRADRPGQVRGMPWGSAAHLTLYDLDGFEDAYLFRQKLANCIMGWVYDHAPSIGTTGAAANPLPETLEPGMVAGLPPGKDIKFNDPPSGDSYGPFTKAALYRVAAAYGISYEALTGDLSQANFASGRMGWLEMCRNIERWRWHMLIPRCCDVIAKWFFEALQLMGERVDGARIVWTPPRREMLNPAQEVPAMTRAVRAGLYSLSHAHRELGLSTDEVLDEIEATNKVADAKGLVLDSDPRKTSVAGLTQARPEGTTLPSTDIGDE